MQLTLQRKYYTPSSTIGELSIDERFECYILEDPVRPQKIPGETAIPAGTYNITISRSPKFRRDLPLVEDVPGFEGIRIHPGNTPADTEGCLIPGRTRATDYVGESKSAFDSLLSKLCGAFDAGDKVAIRILEDPQSPVIGSIVPDGVLFRVTADPLRLRAQPSEAGEIVARLPYGTLLTPTNQITRDDWICVTVDIDGKTAAGYVFAKYVDPVSKGAPVAGKAAKWWRVTASSLNLRTRPAELTDETVIAALPRGQMVSFVGLTGESFWWEVETIYHNNTLRGFVNALQLAPDDETGSDVTPDFTQSPDVQITERGVALIMSFEGQDQPSKWPGGNSGITLGIGYDLGYKAHDEFMGDWGPHLTPDQLSRLVVALGKRAGAARKIAPQFVDIRIGREQAEQVFAKSSIPWIKLNTAKAFPGIQRLPPDAQSALASLVFNRGIDMEGPRRSEMRDIQESIADDTLAISEKLTRIAASIRSMERLWQGVPDVGRGLIRRREAEASLVESCG